MHDTYCRLVSERGIRVIAVSVLLHDEAGRVLLVERGHGPNAGLWSLPGGRVEPGEALARAGVRELAEETGLVVEVGRELDILEVRAAGTTYEIHVLAGCVMSGVLRAGDDAADARWCTPDDWAALPLTDGLAHLLEGRRR